MGWRALGWGKAWFAFFALVFSYAGGAGFAAQSFSRCPSEYSVLIYTPPVQTAWDTLWLPWSVLTAIPYGLMFYGGPQAEFFAAIVAFASAAFLKRGLARVYLSGLPLLAACTPIAILSWHFWFARFWAHVGKC